MKDLSEFKNQIIKYGIIIAAAIAVISFFFLGYKFLWGLLAGTAVACFNFNLIVITGRNVAKTGRRASVVGGYFIRMPIYGIVFYLCIRSSLLAAAGCGVGFLTVPLAIFYIYGIRSKFPGARKNPLNESDTPRTWRDLDEDDWDEEDDWGVTSTQKDKDTEKKD